jgi:hypothetical protein
MKTQIVRAAGALALSAAASATGLAAQGAAAAVPATPAPFREAVSAELKAGLTVADAREVAAAGGRYYVVIYAYPENAAEHGGDKTLKIYFLPDGSKTVKTTDLYDEHLIDFGTYEDAKTAFADVNRDGSTDMIVSVANGGNCWQCSRVLLYSLGGDELRLLVAEPMTLKDLDGDGRAELLVGDTRWEGYDDFAHAFAPGGTLVYKWYADKGYVFAGPDADAFYRAEMARVLADVPDAVKAIDATQEFGDEQYVSDAISLYLIYAYTEQYDRGRDEFVRMMGEHVASDAMRQHRKRILDDFLTGDSSQRLREPRRAEALRAPTKE